LVRRKKCDLFCAAFKLSGADDKLRESRLPQLDLECSDLKPPGNNRKCNIKHLCWQFELEMLQDYKSYGICPFCGPFILLSKQETVSSRPERRIATVGLDRFHCPGKVSAEPSVTH
jgi:hypothetical protein